MATDNFNNDEIIYFNIENTIKMKNQLQIQN